MWRINIILISRIPKAINICLIFKVDLLQRIKYRGLQQDIFLLPKTITIKDMNKKQQQSQGKNLLQQFYSRLNISWIDKPDNLTSNPILRKTEKNLISKSIAQKIHNSKRSKLNQSKNEPKQKQSAHIFTTFGITPNHFHQRRKSQHSAIAIEAKQNRASKFKKYMNSTISQASKEINVFRASELSNINNSRRLQSSTQKYEVDSHRTFRAMSAHLSSRRPRLSMHEPFHGRKTWQNWVKRETSLEQKYQVKGWDVEMDNLDVNLIELRAHTQH